MVGEGAEAEAGVLDGVDSYKTVHYEAVSVEDETKASWTFSEFKISIEVCISAFAFAGWLFNLEGRM